MEPDDYVNEFVFNKGGDDSLVKDDTGQDIPNVAKDVPGGADEISMSGSVLYKSILYDLCKKTFSCPTLFTSN